MNIIKYFNDLNIFKKSLLVPVLIIVAMIGLGVLNFTELKRVSTEMGIVTHELAPETQLASQLMREVYRQRLAMKDYIKTSEESAVERFRASEQRFKQAVKETAGLDRDPVRTGLLKKITTRDTRYAETFHQDVVNNMHERNRIVTGILDKKGPLAEKDLSAIMASAHRDGDIQAAYLAGLTQKHLLLARLYVYKYLTHNTVETRERAEKELVVTAKAMQDLRANLENPARVALATEVESSLETYHSAFKEVVSAIEKRNAAITGTLDKLGPEMTKTADDLQQSVLKTLSDEAVTVGRIITELNTRAGVLTFIVAVIGLLLSYLIIRSIVRPLATTNRMVNEMIADIDAGQGDLSVRFPVTSNDEVGQLTGNCNKLVGTLDDIIKRIANASTQVATAAEELSAVTEQTSSGINRQKLETDQVATAMNEMAATVQSGLFGFGSSM